MEFVIAALDILRVEARALRRGAASLWTELVLMAVAAAMLLIGFGLVGLGLFLTFRGYLGTSPAAFLTGAIALVVAGGLMWVVRLYRE